jgi:hypothetical protein
MVATTLLLVALTMLGSNVLPSLRTLEGAADVADEQLALERAADAVVRVVRAARGGPGGLGIASEGSALVVDLGNGPDAPRARISISEGELRVSAAGSAPLPQGIPSGILSVGLDDPPSAIELLMSTPSVDGEPVAVAVELVSGEHRASRVIRLRARR